MTSFSMTSSSILGFQATQLVCLGLITSAEREVKDLRSSGMFQSCNFGTAECPKVASELVRDIFEFFDLFFQGKEIIMRKCYFWTK